MTSAVIQRAQSLEMKRQLSGGLQVADAKVQPTLVPPPTSIPISIKPNSGRKSSSLAKSKSMDGPGVPLANNPKVLEKLHRAPSYDTSVSPLLMPSGRPTPPKPIAIGKANSSKALSPAKVQSKSLYHAISPELLSVSPLQPSPSMMLLNRTAEVLLNDHASQHLRRMQVQTTTQVFEVRKTSAKEMTSKLSRQESLLAVFKPATDEEDSLLVKSESSFRFNAEERALRERAAYVLDKTNKSFSRVPATALARVKDSNGSLQQYVLSNGNAEDNPELVGMASAEEVQRIAILDCRIMNLDRHNGNVLVSREKPANKSRNSLDEDSGFTIGEDAFDEGEVLLIPIDHSLTLPPWTNLGEAWFDWCYWPQSEESLTETTRSLVASLDVSKDEKELVELGIRPECVATYRICTHALQGLVKHDNNITPRSLGEFFQRPYSVGHKLHHMESPLEHIVNEACTRARVARDDVVPAEDFFVQFDSVLLEYVKDGAWRSYVV